MFIFKLNKSYHLWLAMIYVVLIVFGLFCKERKEKPYDSIECVYCFIGWYVSHIVRICDRKYIIGASKGSRLGQIWESWCVGEVFLIRFEYMLVSLLLLISI